MRIYRFDLATKRISTLATPASVSTSTVLTSRLYPVEVEESADASVASISGNVLTPPIDMIDVTAEIVAGELRAILLTTEIPPESIDTVAEIVAGELRQILISVGADDAVDTSAQIIYGELVRILITTVVVPEGVDTTATIVAGTLT